MDVQINQLNITLIPELVRINAPFEEFTAFIGELVIVLEAHIEDIKTEEGEEFQSAIMWCEIEGTGSFHLIRSSALAVRSTVEILVERDLLPIACIPSIQGKSHYLDTPNGKS